MMIGSERKSGVLGATHKNSSVKFWFREGEMVRAERHDNPSANWQTCVRAALTWQDGEFWFTEQAVPYLDEIGVKLSDLVEASYYPAQYGRRA